MMVVPVRFIDPLGLTRRAEPVTVGLPFPRGLVHDDLRFHMTGTDRVQTQVLDRWSDGSIRWCLFDFCTPDDPLSLAEGVSVILGEPRSPQRHDQADDHEFLRRQLEEGFLCQFADGSSVTQQPWRWERTVLGEVRTRWHFNGDVAAGLKVFGELDIFARHPVARVQITLRNTRAADHPGGTWDLGNGGSYLIQSLGLRFPVSSEAQARFSAEPGLACEDVPRSLRLRQESSGGENWNSINHLDRNRKVPWQFRGYECQIGSAEPKRGNRAVPLLSLKGTKPGAICGLTLCEFWQTFPKQLRLSAEALELDLYPDRADSPLELQGGEQFTTTMTLAWGVDTITQEPLAWARSPLIAHGTPEWYAQAEAVTGLLPRSEDPNPRYLGLVDQAINGPDTFFTKREAIDEYGWRNYGCVVGDHEGMKHQGSEIFISHYNNQYDCVAGFAIQFFRNPDVRWYELLRSAAQHTADIDLYHTDDDKPAYNRGLFWHTYHYAAADTSTHRSYPRRLRQGNVESLTEKMDELGETAKALQAAYAVGGGPSASHCYTTGMLLAYFLTGNPLYRESVLDMAGQILAMEDPQRTPFRFLSSEQTGLATDTQAGFHGPGRASGNAIAALLDGFRLTRDRKFLHMATELIRRVASPKQNLDQLDLLNAEQRWFYTVHLQSIGLYLETKMELVEWDQDYAYARATLLHYARWMAEHERPILSTPERLQYPTETWAAQEIRKVEVFQYAARHAQGAERERYLERAEWFFRYIEQTLSDFPTKSLARPVVLLLRYGWSRAAWQVRPLPPAPEPLAPLDLAQVPEWRMFVPQKAIALKRAKLIFAAGVLFGLLAFAGIISWWVM